MSKSASKLFDDEEPKAMNEGDMNEPTVEEKIQQEIAEQKEEVSQAVDEAINAIKEKPFDDSIQDIQIDAVKKKKFRINGDNDKIIELDVGDVGISYRLKESYEKLNNLMKQVGKRLEELPDDESEESIMAVTDGLKELDDAMKHEIDYIFNSEVAEKCSNGSSMYKPYNKMFVYEHILDVITSLYETNLNNEFTAMRKRVAATTQQYIGKKKPTKKYNH